MAIFHLHMKKISRSEGRSATAAAAYISGEDIYCDREGVTRRYAHRTEAGEIGAKLLILPSGETADRGPFWNGLERHHHRGDAILARELEMALPHELTDTQREEIVRGYAGELAKRYGVAVDACIHKPHDDKNHHVHMLLSACHVALDGSLGKKCVELDPIHCKRAKIANAADEQRERWQDIVNAALEAAGHDSRIDHRTLAAQGIDRAPTVHIGAAATVAEADGVDTRLGNINRQAAADAAELAEIDAEYDRTTRDLQALFVRMRAEEARRQDVKNAITARPAPTAADHAPHVGNLPQTAAEREESARFETDAPFDPVVRFYEICKAYDPRKAQAADLALDGRFMWLYGRYARTLDKDAEEAKSSELLGREDSSLILAEIADGVARYDAADPSSLTSAPAPQQAQKAQPERPERRRDDDSPSIG